MNNENNANANRPAINLFFAWWKQDFKEKPATLWTSKEKNSNQKFPMTLSACAFPVPSGVRAQKKC